MNIFLLSLLFTIYQILQVGLMDGIECCFVNEHVYIKHNFPDILKMEYFYKVPDTFFYAMLSGIMCAAILLIPSFLVKLVILYFCRKNTNSSLLTIFHIIIASIFTVADLVVLANFDSSSEKIQSDENYIYINHKWFYYIHIRTEILSFVSILLCNKILIKNIHYYFSYIIQK